MGNNELDNSTHNNNCNKTIQTNVMLLDTVKPLNTPISPGSALLLRLKAAFQCILSKKKICFDILVEAKVNPGRLASKPCQTYT